MVAKPSSFPADAGSQTANIGSGNNFAINTLSTAAASYPQNVNISFEIGYMGTMGYDGFAGVYWCNATAPTTVLGAGIGSSNGPQGIYVSDSNGEDDAVDSSGNHTYLVQTNVNFATQTFDTVFKNAGTLALIHDFSAQGFQNPMTAAQAAAGSLFVVQGIGGAGGANCYLDNLTITSVPEPTTLALLATGMVCLVAYAWRKRK